MRAGSAPPARSRPTLKGKGSPLWVAGHQPGPVTGRCALRGAGEGPALAPPPATLDVCLRYRRARFPARSPQPQRGGGQSPPGRVCLLEGVPLEQCSLRAGFSCPSPGQGCCWDSAVERHRRNYLSQAKQRGPRRASFAALGGEHPSFGRQNGRIRQKRRIERALVT